MVGPPNGVVKSAADKMSGWRLDRDVQPEPGPSRFLTVECVFGILTDPRTMKGPLMPRQYDMATTTDIGSTVPEPAAATPATSHNDVVVGLIRRRTIDTVLIAAGAVVALVLLAAGGLLTWGSNFADDYVGDELTAQNIFFPDQASLEEEGRTDLVKYADEQVTTGSEAEAYASFIDGHLADIADGATYADLDGPEGAARTAVEEAQAAGEDEATIAELQGEADAITGQRQSLFRGETLRGLLLSTFAWSTIGRIAGIAATVAFVAAAAMVVLAVLGIIHRRRTPAVS